MYMAKVTHGRISARMNHRRPTSPARSPFSRTRASRQDGNGRRRVVLFERILERPDRMNRAHGQNRCAECQSVPQTAVMLPREARDTEAFDERAWWHATGRGKAADETIGVRTKHIAAAGSVDAGKPMARIALTTRGVPIARFVRRARSRALNVPGADELLTDLPEPVRDAENDRPELAHGAPHQRAHDASEQCYTSSERCCGRPRTVVDWMRQSGSLDDHECNDVSGHRTPDRDAEHWRLRRSLCVRVW